MKFYEFALSESSASELESDISDFIFKKKNEKTKRMSFAELLKDFDKRNNKISASLLRSVINNHPLVSISGDTIEFKGTAPQDMVDAGEDGIEDTEDKMANLADPEAIKGIKAEL